MKRQAIDEAMIKAKKAEAEEKDENESGDEGEGEPQEGAEDRDEGAEEDQEGEKEAEMPEKEDERESTEKAMGQCANGAQQPLPGSGKKPAAHSVPISRPGGSASKETKKSDLTENDLLKSLEALERVFSTEDPAARKNSLLEKARSADLSTDERDELFALMSGKAPAAVAPAMGETMTKGIRENSTIQKALDVSDYLREQNGELTKALSDLAEHVESADRRQHEFNLVLAKAVHHTGLLAQAMSERLGVVEAQPARAPKSAGVAPLRKSFEGKPAEGDTMSKAQVLNTMTDMLTKSMQNGGNGLSPSGEDLVMAVSRYEQTGTLSRGMALDVVGEFKKSRTA